MNITIKDVAKELGVSYSSISRALNGKEGVSEETRQRIVEAAERMGYQPNELARGLVNRISNTVGVIIPDILNPYFGEIVNGIIEAAKQKGYNIFLCTSGWNGDTEREYLKILRQKRVDGIIIKPADYSRNMEYDTITTPMIIIDRQEDGEIHNKVGVDNEQGGYIATRHLLERGYRHPVFIIGQEDNYSSSQRLVGAERALKEFGLTLDKNRVAEGWFTIEGGRVAAARSFNSGIEIDSVFGINDLIALGVLQYCNENGLSVPEDVGVIGFDDISYAALPQIQLTTIHQPKHQLGRLLFETLYKEIKGFEGHEQTKIRLEPQLVIRKTTR